MSLYGLSSDTAAALVLARRGLSLKAAIAHSCNRLGSTSGCYQARLALLGESREETKRR